MRNRLTAGGSARAPEGKNCRDGQTHPKACVYSPICRESRVLRTEGCQADRPCIPRSEWGMTPSPASLHGPHRPTALTQGLRQEHTYRKKRERGENANKEQNSHDSVVHQIRELRLKFGSVHTRMSGSGRPVPQCPHLFPSGGRSSCLQTGPGAATRLPTPRWAPKSMRSEARGHTGQTDLVPLLSVGRRRDGKEPGGEWIHAQLWLGCCAPETIKLLISYAPVQN